MNFRKITSLTALLPFIFLLVTSIVLYIVPHGRVAYWSEPPYGHAEMSSLKLFAKRTGLDLAQSLERLNKADVKFDSESKNMLEVAKANGLTHKELYHVMKPEQKDSNQTPTLPEIPQPGLGKRTLKDLCGECNLNIANVMQILKQQNINADQEMNFKAIAEQNQISPMDAYAIIWSNVNNSQSNQ